MDGSALFDFRSDSAQQEVHGTTEISGNFHKVIHGRKALSGQPVVKDTPRNICFLGESILRGARLLQDLAQTFAERPHGLIADFLTGIFPETEQEIGRTVKILDQGDECGIVGRPFGSDVR